MPGLRKAVHSPWVERWSRAKSGGFETGVFAYGPDAQALTTRYVELLRRRAHTYRRRHAARIAYRSDRPAR